MTSCRAPSCLPRWRSGRVAFNVARAVGPATAGALAAWFSSGTAFLIAVLFFLPMIGALRGLKPREQTLRGVPETLWSGVWSGLRYARHSPAIRALLARTLSFSLCGSAFWSLLPVIARDQLGLGAGGFGALSAAFGLGAVVGALSIPSLVQRKSLSSVVTAGFYLWAVATLIVAATGFTALVLIGACAAGVAWVSVLASLSAGFQSTVPAWVRARSVAMNLVAMQASLALGSALWGALASATDTQIALGASAALTLLLHLFNRRLAIEMGSEADVTLGVQLPDLALIGEPLPDDGPVLIQLEYRIDPERRPAFLRAIQAVEHIRRRNGAASWRVFRDLEEEGRFVERFILTSWGEYVRLRSRVTQAEHELQERVEQLQRNGVPIRISRLIGVDTHDRLQAASSEPA